MSRAIILIGMAGSGKTTVGRQVARKLGRPFIDMDDLIEKRFGPIPKLFERGEAWFRQCETQAVEEACALPGTVVATGGGVVTQPRNMEMLKGAGVVVFLDRPIERIVADIDITTRPLYAGGAEALRRVYEARLPLYRQYADFTVDNSGEAAEACQRVSELAREGKL